MRYFIIMVIFTGSCFSARAQIEERMTGLFTNEQMGLTVAVTKSGDMYKGYFEYQKKRYPFTGHKRLGILDAQYDYNGAKIPFTLSYLFNNYYVTSEGHNIPMERKSAETTTNHVREPGSTQSVPENIPEPKMTSTKLPALTGKILTDKYGGYSFQIPAGWISKEEQGTFTLSTPGEAASFTVSPHHYKSKQEIINELQEIVDESTDTYMRPTITENVSNGVFVRLEGKANGTPVLVDIISTVSPHGGGVSFSYGVLPDKNSGKYNSLLRAMAISVQFTKPVISAAATQWKDRLSGRQLIYLSTSGGGSQKITINLYIDGSFTYSNNSSYLSGGSSVLSYAGKSANKGTWKIQSNNSQSVLMLFADDGTTREYILSPRSANGEINLNNRRYFLKSLDQ